MEQKSIEERMSIVEKRLDKVDERLDRGDLKFDAQDGKVDNIIKRLVRMEGKNSRLEKLTTATLVAVVLLFVYLLMKDNANISILKEILSLVSSVAKLA